MDNFLRYITAVTDYYHLSSVTIGNGTVKTNIHISRKLSSIEFIFLWILVSFFFISSALGADPINIVTVYNGFSTTTYNKLWWVYIIAAIIMMILTIIKSLSLFKKLEHAPLNLNIYQREKPSNLRPAHVRLLLNDGIVDEISLAATLLDLIDRGYLSIERCNNSKEDIFRNTKIILRRTNKNMDNLLKFEKFIIEWFIFKYGNGQEVSMQEIENKLKNNYHYETPSKLFENWTGLVFLSFPLEKFYKKYRNKIKNAIYIISIILGIFPVIPFIRNFRYIWFRLLIICIATIFIK